MNKAVFGRGWRHTFYQQIGCKRKWEKSDECQRSSRGGRGRAEVLRRDKKVYARHRKNTGVKIQ